MVHILALQILPSAVALSQNIVQYSNNSKVQWVQVSWAADHRVVDGAALAGLSMEWQRLVENPAQREGEPIGMFMLAAWHVLEPARSGAMKC